MAQQLLPWLLLSVLGLTGSCDTNAKGIEDCRRIEDARCVASAPCGKIDDIAACKRFYRDHCLHGLSVPPPGGPTTDACVQAINDAGTCARATGDEIATACAAFRTQTRACQAVETPESLAACNFLAPDTPVPTEGGSAGDTATGSSTGGGSGGTASPSEGGTSPSSGGSAGAVSSEGGSASMAAGGTPDAPSAGAGGL